MSDHARENCTRCNELEAEVAQLRQERDDLKDGWHIDEHVSHWMERAEAAEAARDHLRARLQQLAEQWKTKADTLTDDDFGYIASPDGWNERAGTLDQCAADLLAVLTEPPQEDIRGNGPINAVGPALDTEGDTP